MSVIFYFAVAMGGCIVGFLIASFSDSKIIRELQDDNRELRRQLSIAKKRPEVTEIRTYTEDSHGFDALYKPF